MIPLGPRGRAEGVVTWRVALQAVAKMLRAREASARDSERRWRADGQLDAADEARGRAQAYRWLAGDFEMITDASYPARQALAQLRKWGAS